MNLGLLLTLSVLVIFAVFGIAFSYVVFLASERSHADDVSDLKESTEHHLEDILIHRH